MALSPVKSDLEKAPYSLHTLAKWNSYSHFNTGTRILEEFLTKEIAMTSKIVLTTVASLFAVSAFAADPATTTAPATQPATAPAATAPAATAAAPVAQPATMKKVAKGKRHGKKKKDEGATK